MTELHQLTPPFSSMNSTPANSQTNHVKSRIDLHLFVAFANVGRHRSIIALCDISLDAITQKCAIM